MVKVITLVIATHSNLYDSFKQTWLKAQQSAKNKGLDYKVFFVYSQKRPDHPRCKLLNSNDLMCNVLDSPTTVLSKISLAIEYVYKNYEYDYIIISNLSTVLIPNRLIPHFETLPRQNYYAGHVFTYRNTPEEIVNWCVSTLSKDVTKYIHDNISTFTNKNGAPGVLLTRLLRPVFPITETLTDYGKYCTKWYVKYKNNINKSIEHYISEIKNNKRIFWVRCRHDNKRQYDKIIHSKLINTFFR